MQDAQLCIIVQLQICCASEPAKHTDLEQNFINAYCLHIDSKFGKPVQMYTSFWFYPGMITQSQLKQKFTSFVRSFASWLYSGLFSIS